jgi:cobalt ECF transporter T component CbiQ
MTHAGAAEDLAAAAGFLQGLDPRVKAVGLLSLILAAVYVHSLAMLGLIFAASVALALSSRVPLRRMLRQVWLPVLLFTGTLAMPAVFLVAGDPLGRIPWLGWTATAQGLRGAAFLLGRGETAASLAVLLVLTTPWPHVLKALRLLGVPVVAVALLGMTHRFIFLLLEAARQMFEAKRSRTVGRLVGRQRRRIATDIAGTLLLRAMQLSEDVHLAMVARGYRGDVFVLDDFRVKPRDWLALSVFMGASAAMIGGTLIA